MTVPGKTVASVAAAMLLAGCSSGPKADLPSIKQARSAAAEWAEINRLAAEGRLMGTYVDAMRAEAREQLGTSLAGISQNPVAATEIRTLLQFPGDAPAARIRVPMNHLQQIEDRLESA